MASKKNGKKKEPEARSRGGFKSSRHGDGKRKASAAGPKASQKRAAEQREHAGEAHTAHEESKADASPRVASTAPSPPPI